ncbi:MAG: TAXI family TRAP transporter solute-binding subunit [Desulfobacteraceae bacterium]|nr:TAXI family TRAP transporter solute-binding subunit [Desulfobacteraceae bacterium]
MITSKIIKSIGSALIILLILCFYLAPAIAFDVLIGTEERKTFSHYSGRIIERVVNQTIKDINCKVIPGSGDIHNLTNLLQGSLDIALIDSKMLYDAINKSGNFKFLDINYQNLSILSPLYSVPITLIVGNNTNINRLVDLKGKRINIGSPLSSQNLFFDMILKAKTWSKKDFSLVAEISDSQSEDTMAFCHGNIDAMIHIGVHPDSSLQQLFKLCNAKLIDMNDDDISTLVRQNSAFSKFTLVSGTYPSQTRDIITFGTQMLMVVSQDLDEETVYSILDTLYTNRERLSNAHPALVVKKPEKMGIPGVKLHRGAIKYFSGQ